MCISVLSEVCAYTTSVTGALVSQNRALGPSELELNMAVRHCIGAENQTWVLCRCS